MKDSEKARRARTITTVVEMFWCVAPLSCRDADLQRRRLDVQNSSKKTPISADVADKELLTPEELAVVLGCRRTLAHRMIKYLILAFVFIRTRVPETKGKILEEIEADMRGGRSMARST
jgi:hypothetical protein